jgi:hypothetical protein
MPLILLEAAPLLEFDLKDRAEFWIYRIGGYLLINVIDDPAWLALMFC